LTRARRLLFGSNPRRTAVRIIVLVALAIVTFTWVLIPIRAEGISMMPTYRSGSINLVSRLTYTYRSPRRGDVVAIRLAGPSVLYVKRVVGLPGERIEIVDGMVRVNGVSLPEPYVRNRKPWNVAEVTLGAREYFVMGDNRGMSAGEHDFGRVQASRIMGKVLF
jgi:signal peptidase I